MYFKMISIQTILNEATFETYFVQVVIKMKTDFNFTEIYNQIRGIRDTEKLDAVSTDDYKYNLLEVKYISEGDAVKTAQMIKTEALKIPGLVKFYVRTKTLLKIRNY